MHSLCTVSYLVIVVRVGSRVVVRVSCSMGWGRRVCGRVAVCVPLAEVQVRAYCDSLACRRPSEAASAGTSWSQRAARRLCKRALSVRSVQRQRGLDLECLFRREPWAGADAWPACWGRCLRFEACVSWLSCGVLFGVHVPVGARCGRAESVGCKAGLLLERRLVHCSVAVEISILCLLSCVLQ